MDQFKHKFFLKWLIYIAIVACFFIASIYLGVIQYGFLLDKSHLSIILTLFYFGSEMIVGVLQKKTSNEIEMVDEMVDFFDNNNDVKVVVNDDKSISLVSGDNSYNVKNNYISSYIYKVAKRLRTYKNSVYDSKPMVESTIDRLYNRNSWGENALTIIVLAGLLGTIVGIIMTFWPFMGTAAVLNLDKIQASLGLVFSGVGAAFYPSAFATIYGLFLMFGNRNMNNSTIELSEKIIDLSENYIIPSLENEQTPQA